MLLASCDDYLDKLPDNRTEVDSGDKIRDLLVSAYPTTHYAAICELMSDNTDEIAGSYTVYNQLQDELATWKDATNIFQDSPASLWEDSYKAIAAANVALQAIEDMGNPAALMPYRGEALLCRAYNHFVLVNIFAKAYSCKTSTTDMGIPYMTQVETTVRPHYDRGTVAEVYAHIAQDIEEGLPLIDDNARLNTINEKYVLLREFARPNEEWAKKADYIEFLYSDKEEHKKDIDILWEQRYNRLGKE